MGRNRKKSESYRLNGYPHLDPLSIHSVEIADLESQIRQLEAKLADPDDPDDKRWTAWWLRRYESELAKKSKGLALKQSERTSDRRDRQVSGDPDKF
jgi:hypothetical protein